MSNKRIFIKKKKIFNVLEKEIKDKTGSFTHSDITWKIFKHLDLDNQKFKNEKECIDFLSDYDLKEMVKDFVYYQNNREFKTKDDYNDWVIDKLSRDEIAKLQEVYLNPKDQTYFSMYRRGDYDECRDYIIDKLGLDINKNDTNKSGLRNHYRIK